MSSLSEFGSKTNSFKKYLTSQYEVPEPREKIRPSLSVTGCHYSLVNPEPVEHPYFVAASTDLASILGLNRSEINNPDFTQIFAGNKLLPNLELQLKGCGTSVFSRGFDGRAVMRSSVREFLVSEAMHHLRVPTTRALTLIGTSQLIVRPWYGGTSEGNPYYDSSDDEGENDTVKGSSASGGGGSEPKSVFKFPPDRRVRESGAIVCRVSRSFLRFGHLELFGKRKDMKLLTEMADYVCFREYPHLLAYTTNNNNTSSTHSTTQIDTTNTTNISNTTTDPSIYLPTSLPRGTPSRYVSLFRCVTEKSAEMVAEWMRVGYVQGNMNSDNCLLGGRTLDFGPYGWMERALNLLADDANAKNCTTTVGVENEEVNNAKEEVSK
eukprot:gene37358-46095_t